MDTDSANNWGSCLGILIGIIGLILSGWLIYGLITHGWQWLSNTGWLFVLRLVEFTIAINVVVFLPMALFRKTRSDSAIGLMISSYIYGFSLILVSTITTYVFWSWTGVIIGFLFAGVGIVPVAFVASLVHHNWLAVGNILFGMFITFGARFLSSYLIYLTVKTSENQV